MEATSPQQSVFYSLALHGVTLLFAMFGLPAILPERADPEPFVMTVEIVPISEITNLPNSRRPIKPKPPEPKPAPKPKPQPEKMIESKPLPEPTPEPEPVPDPEKPADTPEAKKPPKENPQPEKDELADLLKKLQEESNVQEQQEQDEAEQQEQDAASNTRSEKAYDPTIPLSISEKDAIKSQFLRCWRVPAGARDAHTLAARVIVNLAPDGSVQQVALAGDQLSRYQSDQFFRAAADAAIRAVWKCNPIQNLPPEKYDSWKETEFNFDPRDLY